MCRVAHFCNYFIIVIIFTTQSRHFGTFFVTKKIFREWKNKYIFMHNIKKYEHVIIKNKMQSLLDRYLPNTQFKVENFFQISTSLLLQL